jgi:Quercetinase C-terminal cupin domain
MPPSYPAAHELSADRHAWLQVLRGGITANGVALETSDGLTASGERHLEIAAAEPAEAMLLELGRETRKMPEISGRIALPSVASISLTPGPCRIILGLSGRFLRPAGRFVATLPRLESPSNSIKELIRLPVLAMLE